MSNTKSTRRTQLKPSAPKVSAAGTNASLAALASTAAVEPSNQVTNLRAPRELSDIQELVCNLASDALMNGGHPDDIYEMLRAIAHHERRQRFSETPDKDRIEENVEKWTRRLSRLWPEELEQKKESPKTVTDQARANLRRNLRGSFELFLEASRMHELYLMNEVLLFVSNGNLGPDSPHAESVLAEAFAHQLGTDHAYVKVSQSKLEMVEQYVALLPETVK